MAYAYFRDGVWHDASAGFTDMAGDEPVNRTPQWIAGVSDDERAAAGLAFIDEADPLPYGAIETGRTLVDVDGVPTWQVTHMLDLDQVKADLTSQMNAAAGAFRRRFITDIPGQQATYLAKEQEARDWTPGAEEAGFPYLACEASATGAPIADVVTLVLATATQWRSLDPRIEGARRGAAVAIDAASTADDALAAATVDWDALLAS